MWLVPSCHLVVTITTYCQHRWGHPVEYYCIYWHCHWVLGDHILWRNVIHSSSGMLYFHTDFIIMTDFNKNIEDKLQHYLRSTTTTSSMQGSNQIRPGPLEPPDLIFPSLHVNIIRIIQENRKLRYWEYRIMLILSMLYLKSTPLSYSETTIRQKNQEIGKKIAHNNTETAVRNNSATSVSLSSV